ncbi:MAG: DUF1501 domain-containing protein [Tepidisphaerales bacterium]
MKHDAIDSGDGRISRRLALQRGLCGAAGAMLAGNVLGQVQPTTRPTFLAPNVLGLPTTRPAARTAGGKGKAKSVIQIWMWGGPSHLDTFDPKPEAGHDYCGPLDKPIATNVEGIRICELLPLLAQQADKYSIIRSMTHGNDGHETAAYMVQTGRKPGEKLLYPSVGAVVSLFKGYDAGYKGLIPPYIVLTQPQGRFSEAGFLGPKYKPFATGGNPGAAQFAVEGIIAEGITRQRQEGRRDLLHNLGTLDRAVKNDPELVASEQAGKQAYDLILGDEGKVFDLEEESDEVRLAYGRNTFGQSCLVARRLVERGFPYITINYGGWDTHSQHFQQMRQKLPQMDRGMAALLQDLSDRGLLDTTIVWWSGEFGRTPKIDWQPPWDGGRGHYGRCFCAALAGGGFKGGIVVGESDARGETVKNRPVYPVDLIASMYEMLGIDPDGNLPNPGGPPVRVTAGPDEGMPMGGRLKEIM